MEFYSNVEEFEKFLSLYIYIYRKIKKRRIGNFKQERERERDALAHGAGKMSMRFNQGKCCETLKRKKKKKKNGASPACHVTEKYAKIEEAILVISTSICNFYVSLCFEIALFF